MYDEIEKIYLKKNDGMRLVIFEKRFILFFLVLNFLFINSVFNYGILTITLMIFFTLLEVGIIIPIIFIELEYMFRKDLNCLRRISLRKKIRLYLFTYHENSDIPYYVAVLKKYNVKTRKDIELLIMHYRRLQPQKVSSSFSAGGVALTISLAAFLLAGYDRSNDAFFSSMFVMILISIGFIIIGYASIFFIKTLFNVKDDLYRDLEEKLTIIYLNYSKLFSM